MSFDPFILAVDCHDSDMANRLVTIGRNNGFRESGIVLGKAGKIHVTIRSNNRFQLPITRNLVLNNEAYLRYIINMMIDKFKLNEIRLKKFKEDFKLSFSNETQNNNNMKSTEFELNWQMHVKVIFN